jgi:tRNA (mo5U34)-methyltransferase
MKPAADYWFNDEDVFADPDYPVMYFVEHLYANDPTNWWIPNASALAAMLRAAGLPPVSRPEEEVFVCQVADVPATSPRISVTTGPP